MMLKRRCDGKEYPNVATAIHDYKLTKKRRCTTENTVDCILSVDCPLHKPVTVHSDEYGDVFGKMCNLAYAEKHPREIAEALDCDIIETGPYIALIKSSAVRDTQTCSDSNCDPLDDGTWTDLTDAEIYLGVFSGPDAMTQAAQYANTVPENIRLIPIETLMKGE